MKRVLKLTIITPILLGFFSITTVGQSLESQVIGSLGGTNSSSGNTLHFTAGEFVVSLLTAGNNSLSQGFHKGFPNSGTFYWTGSVSHDWNTPGNWSGNAVPAASDNATIPDGTRAPFVNTATNTIKNLRILGNNAIYISPGNAITIEEDCYIENVIIVGSDATSSSSLIVKGTTTSKNSTNLVYQRYVTDQWHLVGVPASGQNINSFTNDGLLVSSGNKYALAPYENGFSTNRWHYYTDNTGSNDIDLAGNFTVGKGYTLQKITPGILQFFGTLRNLDLLGFPITDGTATSGNRWNLLSNPFPSFMAINSNASPTDNFLTENTSNLDPSFLALYLWNPTTSTYDIINHLNSASYLAPVQGFFVKSKQGGGAVNITKAMQSHQTGDLFYRNNNTIPGITLSITNGETNKSTEIKFLETATNGLDPGFDAGMYGDIDPDLELYSHLIMQNNEVPIALQCIPISEITTTIIPIGVHARSGGEITFSAINNNIPESVNVYLEDRDLGVFTALNTDSDTYSLTFNSDQNGVGRFYIHTTSQSLSLDNPVLSQEVSIYKTTPKTIRIQGLHSGLTSFYLYSVLGKLVTQTSFKNKSEKDITLPHSLSKGIYFVLVKNQGVVYRKKIVLD
ncbi:T9SS type A sorting domain-containing protein [Flavobacteriaceae bacterium S356]|uniref:T9SS type A sorting domain-containing protein n=1 Tax=Asprobacillus argus TaxID=3076534 RepID=A0ABU3LB73_9FLAO|nr:T9SS type A sorting domain-containing protein [Flavobacteriaceae bacterium S356]